MEVTDEKISVLTLADGAVTEMIDEQIQACLDNVVDPNTDATRRREVVFKIGIVPDKSRGLANFELSCVSKLAPPAVMETRVVIETKRDGRAQAMEMKSRQTSLEDYAGNVVSIEEKIK